MFPLETKICSKVSEKIRKFDKVMSWWHHYLLLLKKSLELSAIFKKTTANYPRPQLISK